MSQQPLRTLQMSLIMSPALNAREFYGEPVTFQGPKIDLDQAAAMYEAIGFDAVQNSIQNIVRQSHDHHRAMVEKFKPDLPDIDETTHLLVDGAVVPESYTNMLRSVEVRGTTTVGEQSATESETISVGAELEARKRTASASLKEALDEVMARLGHEARRMLRVDFEPDEIEAQKTINARFRMTINPARRCGGFTFEPRTITTPRLTIKDITESANQGADVLLDLYGAGINELSAVNDYYMSRRHTKRLLALANVRVDLDPDNVTENDRLMYTLVSDTEVFELEFQTPPAPDAAFAHTHVVRRVLKTLDILNAGREGAHNIYRNTLRELRNELADLLIKHDNRADLASLIRGDTVLKQPEPVEAANDDKLSSLQSGQLVDVAPGIKAAVFSSRDEAAQFLERLQSELGPDEDEADDEEAEDDEPDDEEADELVIASQRDATDPL